MKGVERRGKRRTGKRPRFMVYSAMYTRRRGSMLVEMLGFDFLWGGGRWGEMSGILGRW